MTLNIIRDRKLTGSVRTAMELLYGNTEVDPDLCRGIIADSAEKAAEAFELVDQAYDKRIKNHVSIQQLVFDRDMQLDSAKRITEEAVDRIGDRFQVVTGISKDLDGRYVMTMMA